MKDKSNGLPVYVFKKDKYRRARGGKTKLIDIYCGSCNALILVYQKDLPRGVLKRCYLDRIFYPPKYSSLQKDKEIEDTKDMPKLQCEKCKNVIGSAIRYTKHGEDRLAYNLIQGNFVKKSSSHGIGKDK